MKFDVTQYNIQHLRNIAKYLTQTRSLYTKNIDRIIRIYEQIPTDVPFDINANPGIKKQIENELQLLAKQVNATVITGINTEWILSGQKNDALIKYVMGSRMIPAVLEQQWMSRNLEGLSAFVKRVDEVGLNLSKRVWSTVRTHAVTIEQHMALGIYEGTPAAKLATEMKQFLNEPDKLFRRVRDAKGNLRLSKAAKEYHPGQGVYRSSYKNALRLTRTEINMAYQQADALRWEKMDFVLGVEVRRSSMPYDCDICESLKGVYPKNYEWSAWHPNCMCYAVPILSDEDDFIDSLDAAYDGREYKFKQITEMPKGFKSFVKETNFKHYGHYH